MQNSLILTLAEQFFVIVTLLKSNTFIAFCDSRWTGPPTTGTK
jgi:hypothetical protein